MTVIPNFLLKKLYRNGSLRQEPEGVAFDFINAIGPGILVKINGITLNNIQYMAHQIFIKIQDKLIRADAINEEHSVKVFLNQSITCVLIGATLTQGTYTITLDLLSKEAGKIVLSVKDQAPTSSLSNPS